MSSMKEHFPTNHLLEIEEKGFYQHLDSCLFRYRSYNENTIKALQDDRLFFSSPINFNDPYDCLPFVDYEKVCAEVNRNIFIGMDAYLDRVKESIPEMAFFTREVLRKDRDRYINGLFNELHQELRSIRQKIRKETKVICFSEALNSLLLWSHYADYHKGFCLAYDKDELLHSEIYSDDGTEIQSVKIRIDPIQYVNQQIDLTEELGLYARYKLPKDPTFRSEEISVGVIKLRQMLLQKAKDWEYEKEWRVTERRLDIERPSGVSYISVRPKAIIVGSQCTKEHHEELIRQAEKKQILIYRMYLSEVENGFQLKLGRGYQYLVF